MLLSFGTHHICTACIPIVQQQGQSVMVYDVYPEAMSKLQDAGAHIAQHPAEVAEKSDTVLTMLPNNSHVLEAYTGENGILQ